MKKSAILLFVALMSLTVAPTYANAKPANPTTITATAPNNEEAAARAEVLKTRLNEIKEMDKSEMTRAERKALRKEVKAIKSELASTNNGVYLSVGANIIIILLLILLL